MKNIAIMNSLSKEDHLFIHAYDQALCIYLTKLTLSSLFGLRLQVVHILGNHYRLTATPQWDLCVVFPNGTTTNWQFGKVSQ